MRMICVDDEIRVMKYTVSLCRALPQVKDVQGFTRAREALDWVRENPVDIALLDIDMPDMNGIALAARIKEAHPDAAVIFLTAFSEYAVDSFAVHPTGYLLKPIDEADLAREVEYARTVRPRRATPHIKVHTFGNFEILVDGEMLSFRRSKAKELLAYLVDRQGRSASRAEIYAALWGDGLYDHSAQKYLDVIIRALRETLRGSGIDDILEMKSGYLRIRPERFECDLYRFLEGDAAAINAYRGMYMSSYDWAVFSEALASDAGGR